MWVEKKKKKKNTRVWGEESTGQDSSLYVKDS